MPEDQLTEILESIRKRNERIFEIIDRSGVLNPFDVKFELDRYGNTKLTLFSNAYDPSNASQDDWYIDYKYRQVEQIQGLHVIRKSSVPGARYLIVAVA